MADLLLRISFLFLSICFTISCKKTETVHIALLHTNDVHGKLNNFDKLKYLKDSLLNTYDTVLLLSAGDMFSGNPFVDNHKEKGFPIIDLMNKVGYDLSILGNHEFDYGQPILEARIEQANFPFICSNLKADTGFISKIDPTYVIEKNGIKLKFFGFIETKNNGKPSTHPKNIEGIEFTSAQKEAEILLNQTTNYAALISLNHHGYFMDSMLAICNSKYDVIIGGHSHTLIEEPKIINNVLITQAGENLENVGLIELTFKNKKLSQRNYKIIKLNALPKQQNELSELIDCYQTDSALNKIIGYTKTTLENRNELGCFFTDAQMYAHDIDFAFQNYYGIRINHLEKGRITRKDIYELDPFSNELVIYTMTEKDIKSLIEYSYSLRKQIDLFISGGRYIIEENSLNHKIEVKLFNNNQDSLSINTIKTYKVGLPDYIARTYDFDYADSGYNTNTTTTENILAYLKDVFEIDYAGCNRTSVIKKGNHN